MACCLPATSFYLGAAYAPAREMIGAGVPVAVATDFNPGSCPGSSLQLAMNIACLKYRMTPEEVLTAVTLNAAAAMERAGPGLCVLSVRQQPGGHGDEEGTDRA